MKRLILFRHGKSTWPDDGQDDADRPLNERGRLAATLMGAWLAERKLVPDAALVSTAVRARQTWERAAAAAGANPAKATTVKSLFMADPQAILKAVREAPEAADTVLLVGHQPGIGGFLRKLSDGKAKAGPARAFEKFPTGGVAVLEIKEGRWRKLDFGAAEFTHFAVPKDLV